MTRDEYLAFLNRGTSPEELAEEEARRHASANLVHETLKRVKSRKILKNQWEWLMLPLTQGDVQVGELEDAILRFGKHNGMRVSALSKIGEPESQDPSYLSWMLSVGDYDLLKNPDGFDPELLKIARFWKELS